MEICDEIHKLKYKGRLKIYLILNKKSILLRCLKVNLRLKLTIRHNHNFILLNQKNSKIMKKMTFAVITMLIIAVLGTSCTKTQTEPAEPGMATVTLHLGINTDETNDTTYNGGFMTQWENVPSGTVVKFVVDSRNLQENPVAGYAYDKLTYDGTVDGSGDVIVELPAIGTAYDVDVKFPDLEVGIKRERYNTVTTNDEVITETEIITKGDEAISVWDGAIIIQEHNY
jgi:hypothetical protein